MAVCHSHSGATMSQQSGALFAVALKRSEIKRMKYEGRDHIVVPVIMAKSDVVMNGAVLPEEEYFPDAWNGVPVTVGHPETPKGEFLSANDPKVLSSWAIGRIFNAYVENGSLRAEAWIDVARANKISSDLVQRLVDGEQIDVSTGYFADAEPVAGVLFGQEYTAVHRNVRPDHLAFLPNEEGACNWEDGCGIRANKRGIMLNKKLAAVANSLKETLDALLALSPESALKVNCKCQENAKQDPDEDEDDDTDPKKDTDKDMGKPPFKKNARGEDDDPRQICADLVSMEESPFLPEDYYGLASMSPKTLKLLADAYRPKKGKSNAAAEQSAQPGEKAVKTEEIQAMIDQAVTKAVAALSTNAKAELSAEDKSAIAFAHKVAAEHRAGLVAKVVANSKFTDETLKGFSVEQLETMAANLTPAAPVVNYGGRALPVDNQASGDEDMAPPSVFANLKKKAA